MSRDSPSNMFRLAWHSLGVLLLTLAPGQIWLGESVWHSSTGRLIQIVGIALVYAISTLLLPRVVRGHLSGHPVLRLAGPMAPLAAFYLLLLVSNASYSRGILLIGSLLFGLLLVVPLVLVRHLRSMVAAVAGSVLWLIVLGITGGRGTASDQEALSLPRTSVIVTSRHLIKATHYGGVVETINGGGLARLGEDILLVTGEGDFWRLRLSEDQMFPEPVDLDPPVNRDDFLAATDSIPDMKEDGFRVLGLLVQPFQDRWRVVISHHHWNESQSCFTVQISETVVDDARLSADAREAVGSAPVWRTLYETRPCLPLKGQGEPFAGPQAGGRIAALGDTALIVTIGDHEFDGVHSQESLSQSADADYGKTLIIPWGGSARVFTLGHRNPQGLLVTPGGQVWLTEHGPEGGDELNLLAEGANYGWPFHTYGTEYGELSWPLTVESSEDAAFSPPQFAWVPSIAVSSLITIETDAFRHWKGDFLVASLGVSRLFRLHREGARVVYSEPIFLGNGIRVRDLVESADGRLVLWLDGGGVFLLSSADQSGIGE